MKRRRLTGWARLWIVILVPVWLLVSFANLSIENVRWYGVCNWYGCPAFPPAPKGDEWWPEDPEANTSPAFKAALEAGVKFERARQARITNDHYARIAADIFFPLIGCLGAFVVAMFARAAIVWVWRAFRPTSN